MGHLYAIRASFLQQWRLIVGSVNYFSVLVGNVPTVAVLAWIAKTADNPAILSHIAVGAFLMTVWNSSVLRLGWALEDDLRFGTLAFSLISRTPLFLMMFGKALALVTFNVFVGLGALAILFLISQQTVEAANVLLFLLSVMIATITVFLVTFGLSPYNVLSGMRRGFLPIFVPLGVVLSGFLYPVSLLPFGLEYVARLLPMPWVMDSITGSIRGGDTMFVAVNWAIAILIGLLYMVLNYGLFKIVERRVRVTGGLVTD